MTALERVADVVWLVRAPLHDGDVCLYVLRGSRLAVLDTGFSHHPADTLAPALAAVGLRLEDVDVILNTHGHPDHLGGNAALKDASDAAISLHVADVPLAGGPEAIIDSSWDFIATMRALGRDADAARREVFLRERVGRDVGVDRALNDGDVVDLGRDVRLLVVHTPGHSPGSASFLLKREGLLFTGDAVQAWGTRPGVLPLYFDAPRYAASLGRIGDLRPRGLCLGHPFYWSGAPTGAASPLRLGEEVWATLHDARAFVDAVDQALAADAPGSTGQSLEARVARTVEALDEPFRLAAAGGTVDALSATAILAHMAAARPGSSGSPPG